ADAELSFLADLAQHEHCDSGAGAYPAAELEPCHARHHQVQDDRARHPLLQQLSSGEAVLSFERVEARVLEVLDDNVADDRLIVDDKDTTHRTIIGIGCYSRLNFTEPPNARHGI